jgi:hypothetical protein
VTVGALFLLSGDTEAFAYALPDHIRTHVEEYGRAEVGEKEADVLNVVKTWTWIPQVVAMVFQVLKVKFLHYPVDTCSFTTTCSSVALAIAILPTYAMFPGLALEALAAGGVEMATMLERAAVGVLAVGFAVDSALGMAAPEYVAGYVGAVGVVALFVVLWRLDRRDGGGRLGHFAAGVRKWIAGSFAIFTAFVFMS